MNSSQLVDFPTNLHLPNTEKSFLTKLKPEPTFVADLMLFYIEQGCKYTLEFGNMREQFYTTLEGNFNKAIRFIFLNGLLANFTNASKNLLTAYRIVAGDSMIRYKIFIRNIGNNQFTQQKPQHTI